MRFTDSHRARTDASATPFTPAGFISRAGALIVDGFFVCVLQAFILLAAGFVLGLAQWLQLRSVVRALDGLALLSVLFTPIVYQLQAWRRYGATPGMRLFCLRIVDFRTGDHPTGLQFLGRFFAQFLTMVLSWIALLFAAMDPSKRFLHDRLVGTLVVNTGHVRDEVPGFWTQYAKIALVVIVLAWIGSLERFKTNPLLRYWTDFRRGDGESLSENGRRNGRGGKGSDFALTPEGSLSTWRWKRIINDVVISQRLTPERGCVATLERRNAPALTINQCLGQVNDAKFLSASGEDLIIVRSLRSLPLEQDTPAVVRVFHGEESVENYALDELMRGTQQPDKSASESGSSRLVSSPLPATRLQGAAGAAALPEDGKTAVLKPAEDLLTAHELSSRRGVHVQTAGGLNYVFTYTGQCFVSDQPLSGREDGSFRWVDELGELHTVYSQEQVPPAHSADVRWLPPGTPCSSFLSKEEKAALAKTAESRRLMQEATESFSAAHGDAPPAESPANPDTVARLPGKKGSGQTSSSPSSRKPVTIYGTAWCRSCAEARRYMQSHSIAYTDLDVEEDATAAARCRELTGCTAVPVIAIGSETMVGFEPQHFEQLRRQ